MRLGFVASVALVALTVFTAAPGGSVCAVMSDSPHSCCAQPAPQPDQEPAGCCGDGRGTPQPPAPSGCDCLHAPTPATTAPVGVPTLTAPHADVAALESGADGELASSASGGSNPDQPTSASECSPPLFLVDCAFLI